MKSRSQKENLDLRIVTDTLNLVTLIKNASEMSEAEAWEESNKLHSTYLKCLEEYKNNQDDGVKQKLNNSLQSYLGSIDKVRHAKENELKRLGEVIKSIVSQSLGELNDGNKIAKD